MTSEGKYLELFADSFLWRLLFWVHVYSRTNVEELSHFNSAQGTALSQCWLEKLVETAGTPSVLGRDKSRASLDCTQHYVRGLHSSWSQSWEAAFSPSFPCLSSSLLCKALWHRCPHFHPWSSQDYAPSRANARFIQVAEAQRFGSRMCEKCIDLIRSKLFFCLVIKISV